MCWGSPTYSLRFDRRSDRRSCRHLSLRVIVCLHCLASSAKRVGLRLLLPLMCMFGIAGCTHQRLHPTQDFILNSHSTLPTSTLIDSVPFIAQDEHACGPASLAMVLQYYGHQQSQERLKPLLLIPEREGTLQVELVSAARREGLLALSGPSRLEVLLADVAAGFPVIVLQNLRFTFWPQWHYAVVVGFDQNEHMVLLRSGQYRLIEVPYNTFLNTWQRAGNWSLTVTRPTQLPPSTTAKQLANAAEALAHARHPAAALGAYATASQRWPDALHLWNGMANLAYAQQRWTLSQQAFAQSLLHDATQARLWNNFAYALQQTACHDQAMAALSCAQSLAPKDPYLQNSRLELDHIKAVKSQSCSVTITSQCLIDPESVSLPDLRLQ